MHVDGLHVNVMKALGDIFNIFWGLSISKLFYFKLKPGIPSIISWFQTFAQVSYKALGIVIWHLLFQYIIYLVDIDSKTTVK